MIKRIFKILLSILNLSLFILLLLNILKLDVIPNKYIILGVIIYALIYTLSILLMITKKIFIRILGYLVLIITSCVFTIGIYYTNKTIDFFNTSFNQIRNTYKNTYYIISTEYNELYDLIDKKISYYSLIPNIDKAFDKLDDTIAFEKVEYDKVTNLFDSNTILIEKSIYEGLKENMKNIDFDKYKKVYEFDITIDEETQNIDVKDVINIYIGGVDFTETFNDFNMIVTINRKTKKVLLTSIPRDYYIYVPSLKTKDLLDYTLLWGVNVPIETLEQLFDTKIDYYVQVNTKSLVNVVDALGGVDFCSDFAFTTTHAMILGDYNDNHGRRLYVKKGCHTYNGIETLTIARERLVYVGGDRQRQKNCQQILINMFNKVVSFKSITNFNNLLDSLKEFYHANIPSKYVLSLANDIVSGEKYTIETQSADGKSGAGYVHVGTYYGPVMIPYEDSITNVKNKLKEIEEIN